MRTAMTTSGRFAPTKPMKLWLKRLRFQSPLSTSQIWAVPVLPPMK
jgi:hypothetical protein